MNLLLQFLHFSLESKNQPVTVQAPSMYWTWKLYSTVFVSSMTLPSSAVMEPWSGMTQ